MASTYSSDQVADGVQPRGEHGPCVVVGEYEISAALVDDDTIKMVKVPQGAIITDIKVMTDDLDTASSPAIKFDVGDGSDRDRFIQQTTIGQGGGRANLDQIGGLGYEYTDDDTIDIKVETAPTTGATSGTIKLVAEYHMYGFN